MLGSDAREYRRAISEKEDARSKCTAGEVAALIGPAIFAPPFPCLTRQSFEVNADCRCCLSCPTYRGCCPSE